MAFRTATDSDRDVILRWRNHPTVRRASLSARAIGRAEHAAWWRAVHADPDRRLLMYCHDGIACGVVTFHIEADRGARWGYYLDVAGLEERGALMPAWIGLEREAVRYAFADLGVERLGGEVLAWNAPVLALHTRLGFRETHRYFREVDGVLQQIVFLEREAVRA